MAEDELLALAKRIQALMAKLADDEEEIYFDDSLKIWVAKMSYRWHFLPLRLLKD